MRKGSRKVYMYMYVIIIIFKLWKYVTLTRYNSMQQYVTLTGNLENTEQGYIQFYHIIFLNN